MVRSRTPVQARISLFRDGAPLATRTVALSPGEDVLPFSESFPDGGLHA